MRYATFLRDPEGGGVHPVEDALATALVYGALGLAELAVAVATPFRDGVLLAFVLLLALALREVYFNGAFAVSERQRADDASRPRRIVEFAFIVATTSAVFRAGFFGDAPELGLFEAGSATAFVAYGVLFGRRHARRAEVSGTMLDDVVRHSSRWYCSRGSRSVPTPRRSSSRRRPPRSSGECSS
jgi:hypothetical protein